jgi:hypothetical protein
MSTTTVTLSGLQEQIIADATALFRTKSSLFNAVYTENAGEALTVKFTISKPPVEAEKQGPELTQLTPRVIKIDSVSTDLDTVPVLARVSKISIKAPNTPMKIAEQLSGAIAKAIDKSVTTIFKDFGQVTDGTQGLTLDDIFEASTELDSTELLGTKILVLHPKSMRKIGKDLLSLVNPNSKSAEYLGTGYLATVGGIQIYVTPFVPIINGVAQNGMYFKENAIGLAYREPIININSMPNFEYVSQDFLADAYFSTIKLNDLAGVALYDKIA